MNTKNNRIFLKNELLNILNARRENRLRVANLVLNKQELFKYLVEFIFYTDKNIATRAAWVFDYVCIAKINLIAPHLNKFSQQLELLTYESNLRTASKVCSLLGTEYNATSKNTIKSTITEVQINLIIENCFDWLTSNCKVATKVHSMSALYLFGKKSTWVHNELKLIIEKNMLKESAAFKARGKRTLYLINQK